MFRRTPLFFAATVALMACGNPASESPQAPAQSQPAQVSQIDSTTSPQVAAAPPAALPVSNAASESAKCLDLVNHAAFTEAVPVCVRAAGLDPENTAVKQALETARKEAAGAALSGSSSIPIARGDMADGGAADGKLP
jgi:hypothetical protein